MEPTQKSPEIDSLLTSITGRDRRESVKSSVCNFCGKPATAFRNEISLREYRISGLCQSCQDATFGED